VRETTTGATLTAAMTNATAVRATNASDFFISIPLKLVVRIALVNTITNYSTQNKRLVKDSYLHACVYKTMAQIIVYDC
jgi:hypothetical protein